MKSAPQLWSILSSTNMYITSISRGALSVGETHHRAYLVLPRLSRSDAAAYFLLITSFSF